MADDQEVLAVLNRRFDRIEDAVGHLHVGLDGLEDSVYDLAERVTRLGEKVDRKLDEMVARWNRRFDELRAEILLPTGSSQELIAVDDRSEQLDA